MKWVSAGLSFPREENRGGSNGVVLADPKAQLGPKHSPAPNPTTSFLTATALIYAIGAGITAAAGTRLALQWILVKGFRLFSFQLQDP